MELFPLDSVAFDYADYFQSREGGHHGTDIFAVRGTTVQAVEPGVAFRQEDPLGGHVVYLNADSGWRYYYAHLDSIASHVTVVPKHVGVGIPLGKVGTSGNAKGKAPHLHFQMKDPRGRLVNPYPFLREVDPHHGGKPRWPWTTPTVGPGKTHPTGLKPKPPGEPGGTKPWWDLSWLTAGGTQAIVVGGLVLWFLSEQGKR